ncbi:MAG: DUF1932 domain-containing protein [Actinomycetota bacterium]
MTVIGFLHPGSMGATLAATADATRLWAGDGRSAATRERAEAAGLVDAGDLAELCRRSDVIVSICPPAAAVEVAESVVATGFDGPYVDANAIAPATAAHIGGLVGQRYIDGGVIGPPARRPGTTRLYLSGPGSTELAARWAGSALDVVALSERPGDTAASALKMAYAGWTKGSSALLLAISAMAERSGVLDALHAEWNLSQPGLVERSAGTAAGSGPKAWRWVGEMAQIAASMDAAGLPAGFHEGAGEVFEQLADFKDGPGPDLADTLAALLDSSGTS